MRTASWNIGDGSDFKKINDLERITYAKGATRIGLQEGSDRQEMISDFIDGTRWKVYAPRLLAGASAVPILYDAAEWKLLRARSVVAVWRRFVGPGAGPRTAKTKRVNVGVFKHRRTKKIVRHLNTHFIASATRPGAMFWRRRTHFEDHARVLARMIGTGKRMRRTEVTMDANAPAGYPGLKVVRETGISGWTTFPTHHDRSIDFVLGCDKHFTEATSSDHRAVIGESI